MRTNIFLTQDEIDKKVQEMDCFKTDYNRWRAFQDGSIKEVTTPFEIYSRKEE